MFLRPVMVISVLGTLGLQGKGSILITNSASTMTLVIIMMIKVVMSIIAAISACSAIQL
jgi:hypothetical protein